MCGRISQTKDVKKLAKRFHIPDWKIPNLKSRYNVAPSQEALVIVQRRAGESMMEQFQWGLIPSWAKDPAIGHRMINARAETISEKPSYRSPLKNQRCLIPVDGFYEWKKEGKSKVPYYIRFKSGEPFAIAGLWSCWVSPEGKEVKTFTIVTTQPNDLMRPIHDRMPVILMENAETYWLDPDKSDAKDLVSLLVPCTSDKLEAYAVSKLVNSPANDTPECIAPITSSQ